MHYEFEREIPSKLKAIHFPKEAVLWNPESWALELEIQHKESGISLMVGIWIPSSTDNQETIPWNPESSAWNHE